LCLCCASIRSRAHASLPPPPKQQKQRRDESPWWSAGAASLHLLIRRQSCHPVSAGTPPAQKGRRCAARKSSRTAVAARRGKRSKDEGETARASARIPARHHCRRGCLHAACLAAALHARGQQLPSPARRAAARGGTTRPSRR
jgi:hypothetical protein